VRTALRIKFPDHQGKYREFTPYPGPFSELEIDYLPHFSRLFPPIPYSAEQGIYPAEQGIISEYQGIFVR
jgi:hypothetical protein